MILKRDAHGLLKTLFSKALKKKKPWQPRRQMAREAKNVYENIHVRDELYLVELAFWGLPPPSTVAESTLAYSAISYTLAALAEKKRCHSDRL